MNRFEGVEKAAAAREAREAVGSAQRHPGGRTDEIEAALVHYLSTEHYRDRKPVARDDDDERQDPADPS